MSIAQLMKDMAAAGAPMEAIIMAVEALEARDNAAKAEREKAAERKRRQRARERGHDAASVTVTGQSQDNHCDTPLKVSPQTPLPKTPVYINPPTPQGGEVVDLAGKPIREPRKPRNREAEFVLPPQIPAEPWDGWVAMRTRIRKPLTEQAKRLAADKLLGLVAKGHSAAEILNNSTMNGWQGLFEPTAKPAPTASGAWDAITRRRGCGP